MFINRKHFFRAVMLIGALIILPGCKTLLPGSSGSVSLETPDAAVEVSFNSEDRRRIANYYKVRAKNVPPGLAKKNKLPPGLQKQLVKNGTLPPGLERSSLPMELEQQLEHLPVGYVRLKVGLDVVLVQEESRIIIDIIYNPAQ